MKQQIISRGRGEWLLRNVGQETKLNEADTHPSVSERKLRSWNQMKLTYSAVFWASFSFINVAAAEPAC